MAWTAKHRYARISERKARLVVDMIRGLPCDQAVEVLRFTHKRAATMVDRVLKSAMASANEQEATMNKLVVDMIRGLPCDQAVEVLRFTHKRAAAMIDRVLKSAMASANEQEATMNKLVVAEARVDAGPIIKRFRPKDRGRAHAIQKRTSHIIVAVDEKE